MKQTVFAMIAVASLFIGATSCSQQPSAKDQTTVPAEFTISKEKLMDKIKGGSPDKTAIAERAETRKPQGKTTYKNM